MSSSSCLAARSKGRLECQQNRRRREWCSRRNKTTVKETENRVFNPRILNDVNQINQYSTFVKMPPKLRLCSACVRTAQSGYRSLDGLPVCGFVCHRANLVILCQHHSASKRRHLLLPGHPFCLDSWIVLTPSVTFGCLATLPSWCPFVAFVTGQTASSEASPTGGWSAGR